jgi:hypothetical protein
MQHFMPLDNARCDALPDKCPRAADFCDKFVNFATPRGYLLLR